jgi:hypothetical protein
VVEDETYRHKTQHNTNKNYVSSEALTAATLKFTICSGIDAL